VSRRENRQESMPLSSMTGFARTTVTVHGAKFSWELKSVNARGLEVRVRLPAGLEYLEPDIRAVAREQLTRGSCFLSLEREDDPGGPTLALNEQALALVIAAARRLAAENGIAMPTADGLLAIPGVLTDRDPQKGRVRTEDFDLALLETMKEAFASLVVSREEEGSRLRTVVEAQLAAISRLVEEAAAVSAEAPEVLRARIREQVALLSQDNGLDPERLHQEAVLAATRADVREELDRLRSHVEGARKLLRAEGAVGRRLDFLTQEFNREVNTLCSKSFDRRLTAIGIELKAVVDQLREQVQNIA
jgi:uncharacterized protein (TIGR00255 family)